MADYDCEYCNQTKCTRFQYNCAFDVVSSYSSEKLQKMRDVVKDIEGKLNELESLNDEYTYLEDHLSSIRFKLNEITESISKELEEEWDEINRED